MKKIISVILCAVLMLACLAACQSTPEVPYVTGEGVQLNPQPTQPNQPNQPTQGGQQATAPPTQGGQQTTVPPTQGGQQTTEPPTQPTQGGELTTDPTWPLPVGPQTTAPATQPSQTDPTEDEDFVLPTPEECTYEQYINMTGDQQEAFFNQFNGDFAAFFAWMDKAKAESDANSGDIEIDPDTTIDLDNIFGNN